MNTVTSRTGEDATVNSRSYAYRTDEHPAAAIYTLSRISIRISIPPPHRWS